MTSNGVVHRADFPDGKRPVTLGYLPGSDQLVEMLDWTTREYRLRGESRNRRMPESWVSDDETEWRPND